jgi:hypothetical protein
MITLSDPFTIYSFSYVDAYGIPQTVNYVTDMPNSDHIVRLLALSEITISFNFCIFYFTISATLMHMKSLLLSTTLKMSDNNKQMITLINFHLIGLVKTT